MSNGKRTRTSIFTSSKDTVTASRRAANSPQAHSPTYRLAFADEDFLLSDETRAIRLQLEWQKFDQLLDNAQVDNTIVLFGSARIQEPQQARAVVMDLKRRLRAAANQPAISEALSRDLKIAIRLQKLAPYYDQAKRLSELIAREGVHHFGFPCTVITGGGPGIMEAANRGSFEAGAPSIGLNIVLPSEQHPNPFVSPHLSFQFHYFAIRKMHFLMRARAIVAFPGGYGTLDEIFETLTLRQTGRVTAMPILLMGKRYWSKLINWQMLCDEGVVSEEDLKLFQYVENADEAFNVIADFFKKQPLQAI